MTRKPIGMVLSHPDTGGLYCYDGRWRTSLNPIDVKVYRQKTAAEKRAMTVHSTVNGITDYATIHFIYDEDEITASAQIVRKEQ